MKRQAVCLSPDYCPLKRYGRDGQPNLCPKRTYSNRQSRNRVAACPWRKEG